MHASTKLCLARHGETDWNVAGVLQGWTDIPLNRKGREQARDLSRMLARAHFSHVCSSPLARATETAQIVADRLDLPAPSHHPGLKERHFGIAQGRPKAELSLTHPEMMQGILRRDPATHFEQGESCEQFAERVTTAIHDIAARHLGGRVLVVTHGWVMDVITRHVRRLAPDAVLHRRRRNGECLWVKVRPGATILASHEN